MRSNVIFLIVALSMQCNFAMDVSLNNDNNLSTRRFNCNDPAHQIQSGGMLNFISGTLFGAGSSMLAVNHFNSENQSEEATAWLVVGGVTCVSIGLVCFAVNSCVRRIENAIMRSRRF